MWPQTKARRESSQTRRIKSDVSKSDASNGAGQTGQIKRDRSNGRKRRRPDTELRTARKPTRSARNSPRKPDRHTTRRRKVDNSRESRKPVENAKRQRSTNSSSIVNTVETCHSHHTVHTASVILITHTVPLHHQREQNETSAVTHGMTTQCSSNDYKKLNGIFSGVVFSGRGFLFETGSFVFQRWERNPSKRQSKRPHFTGNTVCPSPASEQTRGRRVGSVFGRRRADQD